MPGRRHSAGNGYKYGFNGKENDNEVKGEGSQQDYGMRIYDPRTGKFLSVDPLAAEFPFYTPYQFAGNKPIYALDLDGAEELPYLDQYEYDGSWGFFDRLKAIPNTAGRVYNHAVAGTWNSGVANVRSVARGTWTEDMGNELKQIGTGIKNEAVATFKYHTNTSGTQQLKDFGKYLTDPQRGEDILQFSVATYTGTKFGSGKGNLTKPTSTKNVPQTQKWVDEAGNIIWPKNNGFATTPKTVTLQKGARFDRYGAETGSFASPVGTPYTQRSLAPGSKHKPLITYEVLKPFDASSGKAAAWFGEEGGGVQYKFNMSIKDLKKGGYIKEIKQ